MLQIRLHTVGEIEDESRVDPHIIATAYPHEPYMSVLDHSLTALQEHSSIAEARVDLDLCEPHDEVWAVDRSAHDWVWWHLLGGLV